MPITLTLELSQLKDPAVSSPFYALVAALSGTSNAAAQAATPAPAAPKAAAKTEAPAAPAAPAPAAAPKAAPAAAKPAAKPAKRTTKLAGATAGATDIQSLVATMPERTQRFVAFLERKGLVRMSEALAELGLTQPKSMGGLTGALSRWSRERGIELPFEAIKINGERAWRWHKEGGTTTEKGLVRPASPVTPVAAPTPQIRRRKNKPVRNQPRVPAKAPVAAKAPKAPKAPKAAPAQPGSTDDAAFAEYLASLRERPRAFLNLLAEKGTVTLVEAVEALGIEKPKAMGGLTGSLARWAPVRGIELPYETIEIDGERAWRWTRGAAPKAAAAPANDANVDAFFGALPDRSERFARLLQEKGTLAMPEVLKAFGLSRAKAVGGIIEPLKRIGKAHGIDPAYEVGTNDEGQKTWTWPS